MAKRTKKLTDQEVIDFLYPRAQHMASAEYYWLKQMGRVVSWYKKELSPRQRAPLDEFVKTYSDAPAMPKLKVNKKTKKAKFSKDSHLASCEWCQANK